MNRHSDEDRKMLAEIRRIVTERRRQSGEPRYRVMTQDEINRREAAGLKTKGTNSFEELIKKYPQHWSGKGVKL